MIVDAQTIVDAEVIEQDVALPEPDRFVPEPDMAVEPPPPPVHYISVRLAPRRPVFTMEMQPQATAEVFDRSGNPLEGVPLEWRVVPEGIAEVGAEGLLVFRGEGAGAVLACYEEVCGRGAFYVDAAAPILQVTSPERGASLGADGARTIHVRGTATDTGADVSVRVNGLRVAVGEGGVFSIDLPAKFGVNHLVVTADDGVRGPPVRDARDVLWAPTYTPADESGVNIPKALSLRLDQALLDTDAAVDVPEEAGNLELTEIAQLIGGLVALAELDDALGDPQVVDGDGFSLRIEGIDIGEVQADLRFTNGGMELFLRVPQLEIATSGQLDLEGTVISMDGAVRAGLAAFAQLEMSLEEGELNVEVVDSGIAVESIGGLFEDPTAQVLVGTLGSRLSNIAHELAADLVTDLIANQLPRIITTALDSLVSALARLPFNLNPNLEGVDPLVLELQMRPAELRLARNDTLRLDMQGRVAQPGLVVAPHADPGVATLSPEDFPTVAGEGFAATVRLALLNSLLHEIWRGGLLQMSPPLPDAIAGLFGSVLIDGRLPPVVAPAPAGWEQPFVVQIGDLRLSTLAEGADRPDVYAMFLRVGLWVNVEGGTLELVIADDPELDAVLISKGSERAFSAAALAGLVGTAVWPILVEQLQGSLRFGIDPIRVNDMGLQDFAPRLNGITLEPRFEQEPFTEAGRIFLEGGIWTVLDLGE